MKIYASLPFLLVAFTAGCKSDCDKFYDTYESCGYQDPGEDVNGKRDRCNDDTDRSEACATDYKALGKCMDKLDDVCTYPDDCGQYIESAFYHCTATR